MKLTSLFQNKKIIVFGTGKLSKNITNIFPYKISYYIDNNQKKWQRKLFHKPIKSPKVLEQENKNNIIIIVGSSYYADISSQLKEMGFIENHHFINGTDLLYLYRTKKNRSKKGKFNIILKKILTFKFVIKLYYLFFNNKFDRELLSTFVGINRPNVDNFRRNIHRLEKGLIMKSRKEIYALDYIEETVDEFGKLISTDKYYSTLKWGYDVLTEYFRTVGKSFYLNMVEDKFLKFAKEFNCDNEGTREIPYHRQAKKDFNIEYENFYKLALYRRSVRFFKDKKVPREKIDKAIKIALQSPSACNRQPFRMKIIDDEKLKKQVSALPMGIRGFNEQIPVLAVLIGNLSSFFDERDRHLIYIDTSLYAMSFVYALEIQGISSCIINWPDLESQDLKMNKLLDLRDYERTIMLIGFGYADESVPVAYSSKKTLDEIRSFNNE